jgi:hypothetical protein
LAASGLPSAICHLPSAICHLAVWVLGYLGTWVFVWCLVFPFVPFRGSIQRAVAAVYDRRKIALIWVRFDRAIFVEFSR